MKVETVYTNGFYTKLLLTDDTEHTQTIREFTLWPVKISITSEKPALFMIAVGILAFTIVFGLGIPPELQEEN